MVKYTLYELIYISCYRCSEKGCFCREKVANEKFHLTNDLVHFHRLHNTDAEYHLKLNELKAQVMSQKQTVRKIYRLALRDMNFEMAGRFDWKKARVRHSKVLYGIVQYLQYFPKEYCSIVQYLQYLQYLPYKHCKYCTILTILFI